nr:putative reverse transcriptase domain-containing protein [Tanacetum cinerariifolium]
MPFRDESLVILMKEHQLDDKLNFMEEPIEIIDREVKKLKQSLDRNLDDFFITENFSMILGQPVHTNDDVETTEFNWHEINFERILSIEARDMDMKLLSAPKSNNTLARFLDWVTHLVANLTLDRARSCVMQVTSSAPRKSDCKIHLPSFLPQFEDNTSLSRAS